jgi:hypoxanthine-guanine phosphoribosyltransferase
MGRIAVDQKNMWNDYLILMDLDFSWKEKEVDIIIDMVNYGTTISKLSKRFKREGDEVFLLLLHLARKNKINPEHNIFK